MKKDNKVEELRGHNVRDNYKPPASRRSKNLEVFGIVESIHRIVVGNPPHIQLQFQVLQVIEHQLRVIMRDFTYAELQAAIEGINAKNFLSEGEFGSVYREEINGTKIAVKQHKYNASLQGEKEFKSEVQVLRKARHENLVMLVGSCSEGNHRVLLCW
ncbi:hypothetical protein REPUB_Repub07fG0067000 [Reevesia pubescens]